MTTARDGAAARDRGVDALRAVAILGVVLGHWLVTALVVDDGTVRVASPLRAVPGLAPATWLLQTLALFFFVGGLVATRRRAGAERGAAAPVTGSGARLGARHGTGHGTARRGADGGERPGRTFAAHRAWAAARLRRLFRPVLVLVAVWSLIVIGATLYASAEPGGLAAALRSHTVLKLVASPLWFLLVFAALSMARPLVRRLHPAVPLVVVAAVDLGRFALGAPAWIGWVNLAAGWLVPFSLGAAWSRGALRSRAAAWGMLAGGLAATVTLVGWFGYPVSMVGVPGQGISNLNPPTLAAVTFGIAQCGLALLLLPALRRVMLRARPWRAVSAVNRSAMTIFLWHQTSLLAVSLLVPGPLPGLHTAPAGASWLGARLAWLPVFALALLACRRLFHRYEHQPPAAARTPDPADPPTPATAPPADDPETRRLSPLRS